MKTQTPTAEDARHFNTKKVRMMLIAGKKLTKRGLDRLLDVTNSSEIIRRLRKSGMSIKTTRKTSREGKTYGEYSYVPPKKVNRITAGTYSRV